MAVTITIEGDGLSLKRDTNLQKAGQIISFLGLEENFTNQGTGTGPTLSPMVALGTTSTSTINDLILESKAKTSAQKITVVGSYLSEKDGQEGFLIKEAQLQLKKIGEAPSNFTRDLKAATALQYIVGVDIKAGRYILSEKGKKAIQDKFIGEVKPKTTSKKSGSGFKKANPPRQEVISLSIVTDLEGYPGFHDVPTNADSILWVLAYAVSNNIEELTPREVEFLTDKLLKKIEHKDFSAHNKRNIKSGYVASTDGKFKLQQKGINYLKEVNTKKNNGEK